MSYKGYRGTAQPSGSEIERVLCATFGTVPQWSTQLALDTRTLISSPSAPQLSSNILKQLVYEVASDGILTRLPVQDEYTFYDESVYICHHAHTGTPRSEGAFIWAGSSADDADVLVAQNAAKAITKAGSSNQLIRQGHEPAELLQAIGGILITRRGHRHRAPKRFMLLGRKHLGHIVFDEVDFVPKSLCSAFAYLIAHQVTLQQRKTYLWKGSACSREELGAAKLVAMDISETGEIIEVDDGAEFASFLKIFGPDTTKANIPKCSTFFKKKGLCPDRFTTRLFCIQQVESRSGLFASIFSRRPSWDSRSPARGEGDLKVEAREIAEFTQACLEADSIYLLDAFVKLYVLVGPIFATSSSTQMDLQRAAIFNQTLLFADDYARLAMELDDRPERPKTDVIFRGIPDDLDKLFRHWDEGHGLWGTAGLMAGSRGGYDELKSFPLEEVVAEICRA